MQPLRRAFLILSILFTFMFAGVQEVFAVCGLGDLNGNGRFLVSGTTIEANTDIGFALRNDIGSLIPPTTNGRINIVFSPDYVNGGSEIDTILPITVPSRGGVSSATLVNGIPFNGTYDIGIFSEGLVTSPDVACKTDAPIQITIVNGIDLPAPGVGCANWRDPCVENVTPICHPDIFFCEASISRVELRTGREGSGCLVNADGENYCLQPGTYPFTDMSGLCRCLTSRMPAVFCDSNGDQTPYAQPDNPRIFTSIGCIPFANPSILTEFLLRWFIAISGGVGFVFIIIGVFMILLSRGDKAKFAAGKEVLVSAIAGLLLITFAVFLLRLIGVDILQVLNP